jgi:hypothetical protein
MAKKNLLVHLDVLPDNIFVWKELDRNGQTFYYMAADKIDDIGEEATFAGKYILQSTGKISRTTVIDYGGSMSVAPKKGK